MQMKLLCLVFLSVLGVADVSACDRTKTDQPSIRSVRSLVESKPCVADKMVKVDAYAIRGGSKFWLGDSVGLSGPKIRLLIPREIEHDSNVESVVRYLRSPADFAHATFHADFYGEFSCGSNGRGFLVRRIENLQISRIRSP